MYYVYDYSYLIDKFSDFFNKNTYIQNINELAKLLNVNTYRVKRILEHSDACFLQSEISTMIKELNISCDEYDKCFNTIIKSFRYKKDLYEYLKLNEEEK